MDAWPRAPPSWTRGWTWTLFWRRGGHVPQLMRGWMTRAFSSDVELHVVHVFVLIFCSIG
eukprot:6867271-Prymnesium_polylepis.1